MNSDSEVTGAGRGLRARIERFVPLEVVVLAVLGGFFHFLGQYHFEDRWEGFVYDHRLRFLVPMAFLTAMVYAFMHHRFPDLPLLRGRKLSGALLGEFGLGCMAIGYIAFVDPIIFVDDVGFILRYFDNFREGCFYCFNVEDGPVFGISSAVYGLLGGLLTGLHLMGSETAIHFLTYAGVFAYVVLLFRILRELIPAPGLVALLVILVVTHNLSVQKIFNSGMESPVHVSIVLAALLFYLRRNHRMMWLFLALATISKLDVVPLVLVVGLLWLIENWEGLFPIHPGNALWRSAVLYGVLPVVLWVIFAVLVFGSPLPQSAYAKVYYHNHAQGSWFPFLAHFTKSPYRSPLFYTMLVAFCMHIGATIATRKRLGPLVFGFSFLATMVLYYYYNPAERMAWYYTLPETLMLLQLAVSVHWLWTRLAEVPRFAVVAFLLGISFTLSWSSQIEEIKRLRTYEYAVEKERERVGVYLGIAAGPRDTLMAGHGLNARHHPGYVLDQTGLNSRLMTDFRRNTDSAIAVLQPDWIVMHGTKWEVQKLSKQPYIPDTAFYDITGYYYPTWRVFRRADSWEESVGLYRIGPENIEGTDDHWIKERTEFLHGKAAAYTFVRNDVNPFERFITLGVFRQEADYTIRIRDVFPGDSLVNEINVPIGKYAGRGTPATYALKIPLQRQQYPDRLPPGKRRIELTFEGNPHPVEITDPWVATARK
ncbi:MAG: hypothetical protein AAGN35_00740 [Bacteroidota bacterium]